MYGVESFHLYLFGAHFTVITNQRPLIGIMNSRKPTIAKLLRWCLRLIPHSMDLIYRSGCGENNLADYISRHFYEIPWCDNEGEAYIAYVAEYAILKSLTLKEVQSATRKYQQLQRVIQAIQTDYWMDPGAKEFNKFKDKLSIYDGLILRQNSIIIPATQRRKTRAIAHQVHQYIVKTKQCIR